MSLISAEEWFNLLRQERAEQMVRPPLDCDPGRQPVRDSRMWRPTHDAPAGSEGTPHEVILVNAGDELRRSPDGTVLLASSAVGVLR